ncbi:hypothetical protein RND81_10G162500 [Saponaria officinalis]|uniref:Uncharacterized protein n=1 Tax=Saponaria officinalis TaxID=3572 RepID=A0AAW1I3E7_SAPOF
MANMVNKREERCLGMICQRKTKKQISRRKSQSVFQNRKRGYIHNNLPIENRYPLLPMPPRTVNKALPLTKRCWLRWDTRTKLNCLQACVGSAKLAERIRKAKEQHDGDQFLSCGHQNNKLRGVVL